MAKKQSNTEVMVIDPIKTRRIIVNIVGTSPLIMHRFNQKAWQELLLPSGRKNQAALDAGLKHDPLTEYRGCFYRNRNPKAPTLFHVPNGMIHGALTSAALDIEGVARSKLERLTSIATPDIHLYGVPKLAMHMVRNSDMNRTPDVRTRPVFDRWAISGIAIEYKVNPLGDSQIINLFAAAGVIIGIGDWRPQKGGPFGKFRLADANDKELKELTARAGRSAQQSAYDSPDEYDDDTEELLTWFNAEISRREKDVPSDLPKGGKRPNGHHGEIRV